MFEKVQLVAVKLSEYTAPPKFTAWLVEKVQSVAVKVPALV